MSNLRIADIHVSHLSRKSTSSPGALRRARFSFDQGLPLRTCASRLVVPALRRTGHPFAVSGSEEPSPKIELVFSASPETSRREPRECDLLRTVGNGRDLAVCASNDPDVCPFLLGKVFMLPPLA